VNFQLIELEKVGPEVNVVKLEREKILLLIVVSLLVIFPSIIQIEASYLPLGTTQPNRM
jgi:hypothetical protein